MAFGFGKKFPKKHAFFCIAENLIKINAHNMFIWNNLKNSNFQEKADSGMGIAYIKRKKEIVL